MPTLEWQEATIIDIRNETPHTKRFIFQLEQPFDFKPGQFVTLDLPIHEKKNKRWRSYSIASAPDGSNVFELIIVLLEGGAGTHYLFNEIKCGSKVTLRGPLGVFLLPETIQQDLYFICTGTGIAPFRSMVTHLLKNNIPTKNLHIIFGCRHKSDILYSQEFRELEKNYPQFKYYPCFSRENEVAENEYKGYVHQIYKNLIQAGNPDGTMFYLCGWKNMIDDARQQLKDLGIDKKNIHFELYG
ncbi:MAG: FAD-dependent oxidoreductase [Sediminibacterium sp.]|nr:FAD-dependent oxidoreductase [Sediminibacterium sp.]